MSTKRKSMLANLLDGIRADEVAAARVQDATVAAILRRARTEPREVEVNPESARENSDFMEKMRLGPARVLARHIESKGLVSKDKFIAMLGK